VLTVRPKISELDFRVFGRPLHPELFEIFATRTIVRQEYQLRVDITSSGHLFTWQRDGLTICEVAASHHQPLPEHRLLYQQPVGSAAQQHLNFQKQIDYSFRFQLEPADPRTFASIQTELLKSSPCEGLMFQFQSSGRMALGAISYVNIQSRMNRVHIRAFHTFPDAYVVMKSESVFLVHPLDV
jgi:hypothetical protein